MHANDIPGLLGDADEPNWQPLLQVVGIELVEWFMWMCPVALADGTRVEAYKHRITRRYLYLDGHGRAWGYVETRRGGRYRLMPSVAAMLDLVLSPWWETPLVEPEEIALCWAAIERARLREAA